MYTSKHRAIACLCGVYLSFSTYSWNHLMAFGAAAATSSMELVEMVLRVKTAPISSAAEMKTV